MMTTDTNLSRRKLLASMPAAAAMAPIGATALCRLPAGDDPMIEAVARHRQAWQAHETAWEHMSKTEDEFGSEETARIFLYEYDETEGDAVKNNDEEFHIRWKKTGKKKPVFATDYADIERDVPQHLRGTKQTAAREAWVASKKKELDAAKEAQEERVKQTPAGIALQAAREAGDALTAADEDLLDTSATTVAGVAAVLEYFADLSQHDALDRLFENFEDDDELRAEFLRQLAATLQAAA
jgi:hypothetical protein